MSKFEFKKIYAVNKHDTNIIMKAGFIKVPVGSYATILEADLQHPDVIYAVSKDWISLTDVEPDASSLKAPPKPIIEHQGYKGLTAEELNAQRQDEQEAAATPGKVEELGKAAGVEVTAEARSERIGETAESANKRGRKTTTKDTE